VVSVAQTGATGSAWRPRDHREATGWHLAIRFGERYLSHHHIPEAEVAERATATAARAVGVAATPLGLRPRSVAATPTARPTPYKPAADHPWRRGLPKKG